MDGGYVDSRRADAAFGSLLRAPRSRHGRLEACKLLVPVGRSFGYLQALAHIARARGSDRTEILLLNVRPTLKVGVVSRSTHAGRIAEAQRAFGEDLMRPAMVWLDARRIQYSAEVAFGPTVDTILGYARMKECDAIVIGIDDRANPSRLSPGSVACNALRLSDIPVAVVDENCIEFSARERRGASYRVCVSSR